MNTRNILRLYHTGLLTKRGKTITRGKQTRVSEMLFVFPGTTDRLEASDETGWIACIYVHTDDSTAEYDRSRRKKTTLDIHHCRIDLKPRL